MAIKGLKILFINCFVIFEIIHAQGSSITSCTAQTTKENCKKNNPNIIAFSPLFQGRCCWGGVPPSCKYVPELSAGIIVNPTNQLECGTEIELCNKKEIIDQNEYSSCYSTIVELPYKCCYVGYRYSRRCFPIDVSHTEAFGIFESRFRGINGLSAEDKITIECGSTILTRTLISVFLIIFFITL